MQSTKNSDSQAKKRDYSPFIRWCWGFSFGVLAGLLLSVLVAYYVKRSEVYFLLPPPSGDNLVSKVGERIAGEAQHFHLVDPLPVLEGRDQIEESAEGIAQDWSRTFSGIDMPKESGLQQETDVVERILNASSPEGVYFQVGAFYNPADAQVLRAQLALMGLEASIYGKDLSPELRLFRVRIGPFEVPNDLQRMRQTLLDMEVDFIEIGAGHEN